MNKYDKETIRAYLLGSISDEETLAGIEESLFFNDDFATEIELAEDEIINDYVFENLSAEDRKSAERCFFTGAERQFKLKLTQELREKAKESEQTGKVEKPSFFEILKIFFRQPAYAGAFAVVLIAAIGFSIYFFRNSAPTELAELQTIYEKDRPVQPRISGFKYAPLAAVRGADDNQENTNKIRRIEINLLDAVAKNPSAETRRDLGVFYLTQRKFTDAIRELEKAAALDGVNAKILNDLGSAYFESAQTEPGEKKLEILAKALENFSRAFELNPNLLEALFNKSLCLQEMPLLTNQARESWTLYLEKDSTSDWAQEARKNLEILENLKTTSKTKEQILEDFLAAYRTGDKETAWKINCQTKDLIAEVWLPDQLTRRYLETRNQEDIEALKFIGELEKTTNADFFVTDLAEFYSKIEESQVESLLKAKTLMKDGFQSLKDSKNDEAARIFEESARLFSKTGNDLEEKIAELWSAQSKPRQGKIGESLETLNALEKYSSAKNYKWLGGQAVYWISENYFFQKKFTQRIELCKETLSLSEEIGDTQAQQKSIVCLTDTFDKIGDSGESLKYLAHMPNAKDLYYYGKIQAWRNNLFTANLFNRMQMFAAAENFGKESLAVAKTMLDKSDALNGSLEFLARMYAKEKRFEAALNLANESKLLAQDKAEGKIKIFILAKATLQTADAKRLMERHVEALSDYDAAIELYSQIPENTLNDFAVHKGKLLCYHALNWQMELETELETVLNLSEKYRSKILKDDERQTFFDNEQIVYDVAVENNLLNGESAKAFEIVESSKARSLLDSIEQKKSESFFAGISKPLSLSEIQARMPENVQLVQFAVLPKKTAVWIVTKKEINAVEIDIFEDDLEKKISDYLELIVKKSDKAEIEKSGKELYSLLVKPILSGLDSSKEICLLPDKSLHGLTFAALISDDGRFLLEDLKIFYSPSASIFVFASEKARELGNKKDEHLLSIGNPAFDKKANANLQALPSAEEEARLIAEFYPNAEQFSGSNATKSNFLARLPNAEIVHFAGHYVVAEKPRFSKLLFSDGDLRSFEIAEMYLPKTKLVVLSACQTGIEKFYKGEGAVGAARTFLAIGAPAVVASRWQVDSEATKDLMIAFHRARREKNLNITEALRAAQIKMLAGDNENFRQPYFWSAFSMIGAGAN